MKFQMFFWKFEIFFKKFQIFFRKCVETKPLFSVHSSHVSSRRCMDAYSCSDSDGEEDRRGAPPPRPRRPCPPPLRDAGAHAPDPDAVEKARSLLNLPTQGRITMQQAKEAFVAMARTVHPIRGGSQQLLDLVQRNFKVLCDSIRCEAAMVVDEEAAQLHRKMQQLQALKKNLLRKSGSSSSAALAPAAAAPAHSREEELQPPRRCHEGGDPQEHRRQMPRSSSSSLHQAVQKQPSASSRLRSGGRDTNDDDDRSLASRLADRETSLHGIAPKFKPSDFAMGGGQSGGGGGSGMDMSRFLENFERHKEKDTGWAAEGGYDDTEDRMDRAEVSVPVLMPIKKDGFDGDQFDRIVMEQARAGLRSRASGKKERIQCYEAEPEGLGYYHLEDESSRPGGGGRRRRAIDFSSPASSSMQYTDFKKAFDRSCVLPEIMDEMRKIGTKNAAPRAPLSEERRA
jgi:hypothetical protein